MATVAVLKTVGVKSRARSIRASSAMRNNYTIDDIPQCGWKSCHQRSTVMVTSGPSTKYYCTKQHADWEMDARGRKAEEDQRRRLSNQRAFEQSPAGKLEAMHRAVEEVQRREREDYHRMWGD